MKMVTLHIVSSALMQPAVIKTLNRRDGPILVYRFHLTTPFDFNVLCNNVSLPDSWQPPHNHLGSKHLGTVEAARHD